jgi:hypothetical protein
MGLLRGRKVVFERMTDATLATLLEAAAVVAGAPLGGRPVESGGVDELARALGKALSRKDRKILELEASRFGFESIDAKVFRQSVLGAADRLGLALADDVAVAVRITAGFDVDSEAAPSPASIAASIAANSRALDLIRFALSEDYLLLGRTRVGAGGLT